MNGILSNLYSIFSNSYPGSEFAKELITLFFTHSYGLSEDTGRRQLHPPSFYSYVYSDRKRVFRMNQR